MNSMSDKLDTSLFAEKIVYKFFGKLYGVMSFQVQLLIPNKELEIRCQLLSQEFKDDIMMHYF